MLNMNSVDKNTVHDQEILNQYFAKYWVPGENRGISSYQTIAKKINRHDHILDVGCGSNPLKNYFPNLVGIDPAFHQADIQCTIEDYIPDRLFDVALCLGSINFGNVQIIQRQIEKVVSCLKEKSMIFWRLNPGRQDHNNDMCNQIIFFPWTLEILKEFSIRHNYYQEGQLEEHPTRPRYYAEWKR